MLTLAFVILLFAGYVRAGSSTNAKIGGRADPGAPLQVATAAQRDRLADLIEGATTRQSTSTGSAVGSPGGGASPRSEVDEVAYWHDLAVKRLKLALRFERQRNAARQALRVKLRPYVDSCLSALIWRESRWNVTATNPTTGAYGLPQALPGSKMSSAGADWRTNPATQIRWMQGYVNGRYGGSCGALAFQKAHGWY